METTNNNGLTGWWCDTNTNNRTEDVCVVEEEELPLELTTTTTTPTQIIDPIGIVKQYTLQKE